jgi:hypothetical protein
MTIALILLALLALAAVVATVLVTARDGYGWPQHPSTRPSSGRPSLDSKGDPAAGVARFH